MFTSPVRRCLFTITAVAVEAKTQIESQIEDTNLCRPSELPIYSSKNETKNTDNLPGTKDIGYLENAIRDVRVTLTKYTDELKAYKRVGLEHFDRSRENVDWLIDYLRQEDNMLPKAGAIGIGALTGLIFGLRGGIIKKTIYATTGAAGMAALCYPKEAAEYSQVGLTETKKYLTVAYNFAYGVKKDDPPLDLPSLPKIPTSFSEAWDSIKSSASSLISDKQEKLPLVTDKPTTQEVEEK